jgi:branched-chain amino acid transport system ATP-binding protein
MLAVRDLEVWYGGVAALRGVTIDVAPGEIVAVIGPNGAGKSSLLNTIAGVARARRGTVTFDGQSVLGAAPEKRVARGLALVPEGRRIFGSLSVRENIMIGATARADRPAIAEDAERCFAMFPVLRERQGQRAGKLSGGEQQMLAIARALMARPRLLLLDEPSLGLAPLVIDQVFGAIARLRAEGVTILLVEQNVLRAIGMADRAYVLNSGTVTMSGGATELAGAGFDTAYFGVSPAAAPP